MYSVRIQKNSIRTLETASLHESFEQSVEDTPNNGLPAEQAGATLNTIEGMVSTIKLCSSIDGPGRAWLFVESGLFLGVAWSLGPSCGPVHRQDCWCLVYPESPLNDGLLYVISDHSHLLHNPDLEAGDALGKSPATHH